MGRRCENAPCESKQNAQEVVVGSRRIVCEIGGLGGIAARALHNPPVRSRRGISAEEAAFQGAQSQPSRLWAQHSGTEEGSVAAACLLLLLPAALEAHEWRPRLDFVWQLEVSGAGREAGVDRLLRD